VTEKGHKFYPFLKCGKPGWRDGSVQRLRTSEILTRFLENARSTSSLSFELQHTPSRLDEGVIQKAHPRRTQERMKVPYKGVVVAVVTTSLGPKFGRKARADMSAVGVDCETAALARNLNTSLNYRPLKPCAQLCILSVL